MAAQPVSSHVELPAGSTAYKKDSTVELVDLTAQASALPAGSHNEPLLGATGKRKWIRPAEKFTWAGIVRSSRDMGHTA